MWCGSLQSNLFPELCQSLFIQYIGHVTNNTGPPPSYNNIRGNACPQKLEQLHHQTTAFI